MLTIRKWINILILVCSLKLSSCAPWVTPYILYNQIFFLNKPVLINFWPCRVISTPANTMPSLVPVNAVPKYQGYWWRTISSTPAHREEPGVSFVTRSSLDTSWRWVIIFFSMDSGSYELKCACMRVMNIVGIKKLLKKCYCR